MGVLVLRGLPKVTGPSFEPQHLTPPETKAQVVACLAETAVAPESPETAVGVRRLSLVASPSWPDVLFPQHLIEPAATTAQVWSSPAETWEARASPLTGVGADELESVAEPLPSWPLPC